jgi:hypothetical protein
MPYKTRPSKHPWQSALVGPVLPLELVMAIEESVPVFEASPFSYEAILNALLKIPEGKVTGHLGIPSEALCTVADLTAWPILKLFERSQKSACVPESWKMARIQPVPKSDAIKLLLAGRSGQPTSHLVIN